VEEFKLQVDLDSITLNDLVMLEDPNATATQVRDFLARCVVDNDGNPMGQEKAIELVGTMPLSKLRVFTAQLSEQLRDLSEVPPTKGDK
jgi:hypothetical protein